MAVNARVVAPTSVVEGEVIHFSVVYENFTTLSTAYTIMPSAMTMAPTSLGYAEQGADFENFSMSGSLARSQYPAGNYIQEFQFSTIDDHTIEGPEAVEIYISSSGATFIDTPLGFSFITVSVNILDNDSPTDGDDVLHGTPGVDWIDGLKGNDTIYGDDGPDTLIGGDGNDILDGGTNPTDQGDIMLGGAGDDTYYVDSALDLVDEGFIFPDAGWGGTDTIISTANWYWDSQSVGEIVRIAEDADDPDGAGVTFVGGIFDNVLYGHSGTDILFGRGGNDTYRAGDGVDWISLSTLGLTDENAYAGVDGHNTVIVDPRSSGAFSYDILFEFDPGKDKVDVSAYGSQYASGTDVLSHAVDDGAGSSYIALGDGLDYLYFVGLSKTELLAGDFIV